MFLKRIELQGFKSFADRTVLQFDYDVTGIVGPNGCGKSNVNDAIRWVLGEQSAKSLRTGSGMTDIIFSGSQGRKPVNMAKVTLVFDNTRRIFDIDYDEVEITRQLSRSGNDAGYFINRTPCRLKDINDLVMDTGLGKDSLSIITQGNISSFADAKPEERRSLFEEAAGVAKYKKRKKVSLTRLEHTKENLERLQDLLDELENRLGPLEKQAQKARDYLDLQEQLKSIEISVLADEIEGYQNTISSLNDQLAGWSTSLQTCESELEEKDSQIQSLRRQMYGLDGRISSLQSEKNRLMEKNYALEKRKVELDEKRRYQMETGDQQQKASQLKAMLEEARFDLDDRSRRLEEARQSTVVLERKCQEAKNQLDEQTRLWQQKNQELSGMNSRKNFLEQSIQQPFSHQQGVRAVMEARASLDGIEGVVMQLLRPKKDMAQAVNAALGGAAYNLAARDEAAARAAITFLKKNRSGRATFIPLNVCRPRNVSSSTRSIAASVEGGIGWADELVENNPRYDVLKQSLLGNIYVTRTLAQANECARRLKYAVKIVTTEGDIVHAGGSMTGGSFRNQNSYLANRQELDRLLPEIEKTRQQLQKLQTRTNQNQDGWNTLNQQFTAARIEAAKLENLLAVKQEKYDSLAAQYRQLEGQGRQLDLADADLSLVKEMAGVHEQLDKVSASYEEASRQRLELGETCEEAENRQRQLRREVSSLNASVHQAEMSRVEASTRMESALMRLNTDYQMTYEFAQTQKKDLEMDQARKDVSRLRAQIKALGNVNLEAPEEYEQVRERFGFLSDQKDDLLSARQQILDSIEEMDATMSQQFLDMFHKINEQLDGVFQAMFGGGKARLFLCDPQDILNTGIDIEVQPPGKMVRNLQAFSGGEKALIAISVLFSILKARTVPLCIFDEVEAALDQANVERFARYLSSFRDSSQFIIVTHRPGTMEQCDALFGVTMEKNGVSTVYKVLLKDAEKFAESEVKA